MNVLNKFSDYQLSDALRKAIAELGFETPTPVQDAAIPTLTGQSCDFIGLAQTGTGKTAAFGIPLLENIDVDQKITQGLILAPTRELIQQTENNLIQLGKYMKGLKVFAVYGGTSISNQIKYFRENNPHILLATPGRLLDLLNRHVVNISTIRCLVLDEADEMLNMGFKEDLDIIFKTLTVPHATWLFSATFPDEIRRITKEFMHQPVEFKVAEEDKVNVDIEHQFLIVKRDNKKELLRKILDNNDDKRGIVFCRTKIATQELADELSEKLYPVAPIHGDMSQSQRDAVMKKFKNYQVNFLIATDVAARGIDVKELNLIIHFDMPDDISYYTHRSGRTGRAGHKGLSLMFVAQSRKNMIRILEKKLNIRITMASIPSDLEIAKMRLSRWAMNLAQTKEMDNLHEDLFSSVYFHFKNLNKEELIEKLVTDKIRTFNMHEAALRKSFREEIVSNPVPSFKESKKLGKSEKKFNKNEWMSYFINVGVMDGVGKRDLLTFIAEQGGIDPKLVQNVSISRTNSTFDVHVSCLKNMTNRFKGLKMGSRKLRVNRNQN